MKFLCLHTKFHVRLKEARIFCILCVIKYLITNSTTMKDESDRKYRVETRKINR